MRFEYAGSTFLIEFERNIENITINRGGNKHVKQSKYPYTTARLMEARLNMKPIVLYVYKVGCLPTDSYSNEKGRIAALRGVSDKIQSKELRRAMWTAYRNRKQKSINHK